MPTQAENREMDSLAGRPERETGLRALEAGSTDNAYAAVSVACGEGACFRAEAISGIRFLVDEAPLLPMPNCAAETCTCRYFHFRDRRSFLGNRRSSTGLEGVSDRPRFVRDRRRGPNRRKLRITDAEQPA
jgi:hypothetical protein